jgi:hypothetical protein
MYDPHHRLFIVRCCRQIDRNDQIVGLRISGLIYTPMNGQYEPVINLLDQIIHIRSHPIFTIVHISVLHI